MEGTEGLFLILGFVLRIIGAVVCSNKARLLNRNASGWGVFGFFIPIIAMIWVHCLKPKMLWGSEKDN